MLPCHALQKPQLLNFGTVMDTQEQNFWQQQPGRLPLPEEDPLAPVSPVYELDSDEDCLKDVPEDFQLPEESPEPEPYIPDLTCSPEILEALPENIPDGPTPEDMKIDIVPETLPFPESLFVTPAEASENMDIIPPTDIDDDEDGDEDELSSDVESIVDEEMFYKRVAWANKMDDAKIEALVDKLQKHPRFDEFYQDQVVRNQDFLKSKVEVLAFWDICKEMYAVPDGPPASQVAKVEDKGDAKDEVPLTHKQQAALRKEKQQKNKETKGANGKKPKPKQKGKKKVSTAAASSPAPMAPEVSTTAASTPAPAAAVEVQSSGDRKRKSDQMVDEKEKEKMKKILV